MQRYVCNPRCSGSHVLLPLELASEEGGMHPITLRSHCDHEPSLEAALAGLRRSTWALAGLGHVTGVGFRMLRGSAGFTLDTL